MHQSVWDKCLSQLQSELPSQQFNTWIRPLRVSDDQGGVRLLAPNRFVMDWVNEKFIGRIRELVVQGGLSSVTLAVADRQDTLFRPVSHGAASPLNVVPDVLGTPSLALASKPSSATSSTTKMDFEVAQNLTEVDSFQDLAAFNRDDDSVTSMPEAPNGARVLKEDIEGGLHHRHFLNSSFTFANFVQGKSNQLGLAAAKQVSENPGGSYNPLFIYGGVGLGKTHLMHAVGNALLKRRPGAKVVYLHSERFVADMVKALQLNAINDFKRFYRSVDALLIDDIQFFAGKERSQEEFFHTFNALLEGGQQIILTCDRYPKEISGLEERLKSRFGWGLTVAIEPPELETRVAILIKKAQQASVELPHDAAFFIAQRIRSNVRELEGALKRVIANAEFTGRPVSIELVREALKDLLALQDRLVSVDNIQRVVAEYYKIKVSDLNSKRRSRSVARPRQVAMFLAKDLTNHSLPEIGEYFGGRDHTTVLHACRKIREMQDSDADIREDLKNLLRTLTT